jgi:hypothetical protein
MRAAAAAAILALPAVAAAPAQVVIDMPPPHGAAATEVGDLALARYAGARRRPQYTSSYPAWPWGYGARYGYAYPYVYGYPGLYPYPCACSFYFPGLLVWPFFP